MVLWSRIAPSADAANELANADFILTYEIATDPNFSRRVQSGTVIAMAADGHSVHLEISGLPAGREFYYRFRTGDHVSPIGRTWTANAAGSMRSMRSMRTQPDMRRQGRYLQAALLRLSLS